MTCKIIIVVLVKAYGLRNKKKESNWFLGFSIESGVDFLLVLDLLFFRSAVSTAATIAAPETPSPCDFPDLLWPLDLSLIVSDSLLF